MQIKNPISIFLCVLAISFLNEHCRTTQLKSKKIDDILDTYVNQTKFNGSALVAKNGKIILHKGYGISNAKTRSLRDPNSLYPIGSLTNRLQAR